MKVSKQARREAKELFRNCVVNGVLDDSRVRQTVDQVLAARPRGYHPILTHFERLVKLDIQRRSARIESVVPLGEPLQNTIRANLQKIYGPGLTFTFSQNPALLGGMRIQVGSDVYDGSVQARLTQVRQAFEAA